jgi:hypothetical protein
VADFDSLERVLHDILRALQETNDKPDRIMGVGTYRADLHDLKTALDEIESNTRV